nr:hypothetical protein [Tanacetum cinerariifolium]
MAMKKTRDATDPLLNNLNKSPTNLNRKKFKLDIDYNSLVNSEFKSQANSWIHRKVEEVDLWLFDVGVGQDFTFEDELFLNTSCLTRMTLSFCRFNPPNGVISWERLKKLVFSKYNSYHEICTYEEVYTYCFKINTPYISSLTITGELILPELVLLDVCSLIEVELDDSIDWELGYSIDWRKSGILDEEVFGGFLEILGHVEDITFGDDWSELLGRLKAGTDTSNDDRAENGDREEKIASKLSKQNHKQIPYYNFRLHNQELVGEYHNPALDSRWYNSYFGLCPCTYSKFLFRLFTVRV